MLREALWWCVIDHEASTDGYCATWFKRYSCSVPCRHGYQAFGSFRCAPVCDPVPSFRTGVSDGVSPSACLRSWGEGSSSSEVPSLLWFSEGRSLGVLAGSGNSLCYKAKYTRGLWQNPKGLWPRRTSVVEKHVSAWLGDHLQVGSGLPKRSLLQLGGLGLLGHVCLQIS